MGTDSCPSDRVLRQEAEPAVHGQFVVPEGWRLVPIEPTWEMWDQAENASMQCDWALEGSIDMPEDARQFPTSRIWNLVCAYRAMVAAAPLPEQCKAPEGNESASGYDEEGGGW